MVADLNRDGYLDIVFTVQPAPASDQRAGATYLFGGMPIVFKDARTSTLQLSGPALGSKSAIADLNRMVCST